MSNEEMGVDWEEETKVQKIVDNFKMGIKEGELAAKLARYREIQTEIESLEAIKDSLRTEFLELGKGEESISAGGYAAFFKRVKGRETFDWKQFSVDKVGKPTDEDRERYTKVSDDSMRVEVRKL